MKSEEPDSVRDAKAAALAAVTLLIAVRTALDEEHQQGYAEANPDVVAACMNAGALWHLATISGVESGVIERYK